MKNSELFQKMMDWGRDHESRYEQHEAIKQETIDTYGWDSPEVSAWYAKAEELKKEDPFGPGAWKAWRAVRWNEGDELEIDDSCWPKEYEGFVRTLREFGCKTFLVTNQSSGLMRDIFGYIDNGCRLVGPELIAKVENRYGTMATVNHEALRFEIN